MKKVLLYIHGKGGNPQEAERYRALCPGYQVAGVDYQGELPWEVRGQLRAAYDDARRQSGQVVVLANSIGAYFAMDALQGCPLAKARLTVMENGEHWFHTAEQLAFLDGWVKEVLR